MRARIGIAVGAVLFAGATATTSAWAQQAESEAHVTATTEVPAAPTTVRVETKVDDGTPDHERFVGHFAVGYFGIQNLPIATGFANGTAPNNASGSNVTAVAPLAGTVASPIIGVRYWFRRNLGVDAGIGFGMSGGTIENSNPNANTGVGGTVTVDTNHTSQLAFALHGGLPIAFAYGRHYTFELVPEATLGIASGTISAPPGQQATAGQPSGDTSLSGFRLDLGARVGAEISFGMIGIPELALQASVGLYVRRESIKAAQGNFSASDGSTSIATSVQSDPWAIFADNISALYYF